MGRLRVVPEGWTAVRPRLPEVAGSQDKLTPCFAWIGPKKRGGEIPDGSWVLQEIKQVNWRFLLDDSKAPRRYLAGCRTAY